MGRRLRVFSILGFVACGARTSLPGGDGPPDAMDASDAFIDQTDSAETEPDVFVPPDAPDCERDEDCDDTVACTRNICSPVGRCVFTANDDACDDGRFCSGKERCDVKAGCIPGPKPCGDGISCTVDLCSEEADNCLFLPNDALCPISHVCDPADGCQARAFAHDDVNLYEVRIPSGKLNLIGPIGKALTDIALLPSNELYGIRRGEFYKLDQGTGKATLIGTSGTLPWTALDASPSGELYGAAGTTVYRLTLAGGATTVAQLPPNYFSSGDLAFLGGRLLATVHLGASGVDSLAEVDLFTGTTTILGSTSFNCVWGLAAFGTTLYGLTCEGRILQINHSTGAATELNRVNGLRFGGASAR